VKREYDLAAMKKRRNPYARMLKKQITIRLGTDVIDYFRRLSAETGISCQNLINLHLEERFATARRPSLEWVPKA
jgi:uncharacterized protein (DUF4415 family)